MDFKFDLIGAGKFGTSYTIYKDDINIGQLFINKESFTVTLSVTLTVGEMIAFMKKIDETTDDDIKNMPIII